MWLTVTSRDRFVKWLQSLENKKKKKTVKVGPTNQTEVLTFMATMKWNKINWFNKKFNEKKNIYREAIKGQAVSF